MSLQADIDRAVATLGRLSNTVKDNRQRIAALGGAYLSATAESAAPRSARPHYRYSTPKLVRSIRAPKGMGVKVATYYPGNLGNSLQVLKFRRAKSKVYIGAKLAKGVSPRGNFGTGTKADGYYMHMVEHGTKYAAAHPFWRSAVERGTPQAYRVMLVQWQKLVTQFERRS